MLNFIKRINRGIVLAIILIIGLLCYLIVSYFSFGDQKSAIKNDIVNYAAQYSNVNVFDAKYNSIGVKAIPQNVINAKIDESNKLLNNQFCPYNGEIGSSQGITLFNISSAQTNVSDVIRNRDNSKGIIYSFKIKSTDFGKIKYQNPTFALIQSANFSVEIKYVGAPKIAFFNNSIEVADNGNTNLQTQNLGVGNKTIVDTTNGADISLIVPTDMTTEKTATYNFFLDNVMLEKINGTWKIYSVENVSANFVNAQDVGAAK